MKTIRKTGLWGFEVRFENSSVFEWAAPSLLMDEDGLCIDRHIVEIRSPFSGMVMTPQEFHGMHGPKVN